MAFETKDVMTTHKQARHIKLHGEAALQAGIDSDADIANVLNPRIGGETMEYICRRAYVTCYWS